jgi:murein DD-endopeptidase MepM/ murein hydrolase activator NlpD
MRFINRRAAAWRGLACILAIALCLGSVIAGVRAQEMPAGGSAAIASAGEPVLLREQPGYDAPVLATLGDGNPLDLAGEPVIAADGASWLPVVADGQSGYVPAGYVAAAPTAVGPAVVPEAIPEPAPETAAPPPVSAEPVVAPAPAVAVPSLGTTGATTTEANLRAGPSFDTAILTVLPPGASLAIDGPAENGFVPVTGNGVSGWVAAELLGEGAAVAPPPASSDANTPSIDALALVPAAALPPAASEPAPEMTRDESTGIVWPFAGGEWKVVQGYNTGTHTNRSGFAQYKYSLDWARVDGDTAGQPVFAPVSGTVQWVDRGSGGMLIDAGNGYGVAVFHVTLDRDLARGGTVERGQRIGTISGPGGDGYMSMAHIDITVWSLAGRGHDAVPFMGPNAIAGREFPDSGGANQHMGATVSP